MGGILNEFSIKLANIFYTKLLGVDPKVSPIIEQLRKFSEQEGTKKYLICQKLNSDGVCNLFKDPVTNETQIICGNQAALLTKNN